MIRWRRYDLGDKFPFRSPDELIDEIFDQERDKIGSNKIISFAEKKDNIKISRAAKDGKEYYEITAATSTRPVIGRTWEIDNIIAQGNLDETIGDLINYFSTADKIRLLEVHCDYQFMILNAYEHGGLTISASSAYPYNDRFDAGSCGFIYTTKAEVLETGGMIENTEGKLEPLDNDNWREAAIKWLNGEIDDYDAYLQGEIYYYQIEKYDPEYDYWDSIECVGGLINRKIGKKLIEDLAAEAGIDPAKLFAKSAEAVNKVRKRYLAAENEKRMNEFTDFLNSLNLSGAPISAIGEYVSKKFFVA